MAANPHKLNNADRERLAAECYAAVKCAVVLLAAKSKRPPVLENGKCKRWKDVSVSLDDLFDHIRNGGNYGIQTGAPSGLDVLDIDQPDLHPVLVDRLKAYAPWTETGRGMHFWFRHHARVCKNKSKAIAGIDVKTSGGYVVAPGSVHENGKEYVLYGALEEAPSWPENLLDILFPDTPGGSPVSNLPAPLPPDSVTPYAAKALESAIDTVGTAPEGQRNDTLNREAFGLGGLFHLGLDRRDVEEALVQAALSAELSEGEARATFRSGWEKGVMSPRTIENFGGHKNSSSYTGSSMDTDASVAKQHEYSETQRYWTSDNEVFVLDEKHCVHTNNTDFDVSQGVRAVLAYNKKAIADATKGYKHCEPAPVFNRGGLMVHMSPDRSKLRNTGRPLFDTVLDGKAARWFAIADKEAQRNAPEGLLAVKKSIPRHHVSPGVSAKLLESSDGLPYISKIVNSPIFLPDGTLTRKTGYYTNPGIWYESHPDFKDLRLIPVEEAVHLLLKEFLIDFPFAGPSDRANAIANLLLMFMRDMIPGSTPLFVIEAPTPGTGKSLLVECFSIIAAGGKVAPCSFGNDDEELRKHLTARLLEGPLMVLFDNLPATRVIDRPSLAAVLTTTTWSDRILGRSETVDLSTACVWTATGNNLKWSEELARRIVRIRIVPPMEMPWMRKEFKHDPLKQWVQENRPRLACACISIIQHWIDSGQPQSSKHLGSFEQFVAIMGGILESVGIESFLDNASDFIQQANPDSVNWGRVYAIWAENIGSEWRTAKELLEILLEKAYDLTDEILATVSPKSLGKQLGTKIDRIHGNYRLVSRIISGNRKYSLEAVKPNDNITPKSQDASIDMGTDELF